MSYFYTDSSRESDPHALPDAEVFYVSPAEASERRNDGFESLMVEPGWYVWACFPGCLPDGEPHGPFSSEEEAIAEWRAMYDGGDS